MKKLFGITAVAAIVAAAGWNFSQEQNKMDFSELALANIEALAQYEGDPIGCSNAGCVFDYNYICEVYNQFGLYKVCFYFRSF